MMSFAAAGFDRATHSTCHPIAHHLQGDGTELLTESWEFVAACKTVCTHLTGSEHGGSLLPASSGLRSWGDLLPTTRTMLRMLLSVAQPGGGTMRAALRYLHDQPAPVTPEQLLQDGLPACATAAQYAAFQLLGQRQLMSLCHATEAASGAAALQQFVCWLATMLDQAHGQVHRVAQGGCKCAARLLWNAGN